RRRQDDAHQHHLRDREPERRHDPGGRTRHHPRLSPGPSENRARPAGAVDGHVRDGLGHGPLQPRPVREARQRRLPGEGAPGPGAVGEEGLQDHGAVRRDEAARDHRQGALPRAAHPLSGRTDGRRGRGAAARHVGDGASATSERGHDHPHHPLHRRSRANGGPHRRDRQGENRPRGGDEHADEEAREEAARASAPRAPRRGAPNPGRRAARAVQRWLHARVHVRRSERGHRHRCALASARGRGDSLPGSADQGELPGGDLRQLGEEAPMNVYAIKAIYLFEMARWWRTVLQSIASPVISTSLYFIVFGSAIGSRMAEIDGVSYGAFIVPGLIMLSILTESISNGSFGIYMPKFSGTICEVLSAPVSALEVICGYVGAAATKSVLLGLIILTTARLFVDFTVLHPLWMVGFLVLTSVTFSMFGFIIGVWADGWEKLQVVPIMIVTPLTFLGGSFYSIDMLPPFWQSVTLFNPVVYLISGFRWAFYGISDVGVGVSLGMTVLFLAVCVAVVTWIFKTGYRIKAWSGW